MIFTQVRGDTGADGLGEIEKIENQTMYWKDYILRYSVSQLINADDPSICEIFFVISSPTVRKILPSNFCTEQSVVAVGLKNPTNFV